LHAGTPQVNDIGSFVLSNNKIKLLLAREEALFVFLRSRGMSYPHLNFHSTDAEQAERWKGVAPIQIQESKEVQ
jgi:hypothetical protein